MKSDVKKKNQLRFHGNFKPIVYLHPYVHESKKIVQLEKGQNGNSPVHLDLENGLILPL